MDFDKLKYIWVGINPEDMMVSFIFRGTRLEARRHLHDFMFPEILDLEILAEPITTYIHGDGKAYDIKDGESLLFVLQILPDGFIAEEETNTNRTGGKQRRHKTRKHSRRASL